MTKKSSNFPTRGSVKLTHLPVLQNIISTLKPVDLVFIGFLLLIPLVIFLLFKRSVQEIVVRVEVTGENVFSEPTRPNIEYADSFQVGDVITNQLGQNVAEILDVTSYRITQDRRVVFLDVRLRTLFDPRKQQYFYQGKPVIFSEFMELDFRKAKLRGRIVDFPGFRDEDAPQGIMRVRAQLRWENRQFSDVYGVPKFIADSIQAGDVIRDNRGQPLLKIIEVETNPAKRTVFTESGVPRIVQDPELKDVFYTVDIATKEYNGTPYMFDYFTISVGDTIPINKDHVSIFPVVTEIVEYKTGKTLE
ncbi:MAG: hypothetical protein COU69_03335 [Candidatus Pacebacteria bacterium CG10_big_fil_rev_8_21_14_0_10_56_10]|nr:MAG: hypothetical protein COU69_03335 [Candidatus Pacebacteria bacterium CG10_big_fil_rev_8_21_14_0_10_56_10]